MITRKIERKPGEIVFHEMSREFIWNKIESTLYTKAHLKIRGEVHNIAQARRVALAYVAGLPKW